MDVNLLGGNGTVETLYIYLLLILYHIILLMSIGFESLFGNLYDCTKLPQQNCAF